MHQFHKNIFNKKDKLILLLLALMGSFSAISQSDTTFWFAAPEVSSQANFDRPIVIRVTSYTQPCIVTISQPAGGGMVTQTLNLPANATQSIDLTAWIDFIECAPGNAIQNKGIKINSTDKISVYYEVNQTGPNPEIYVLKGSNALGNEFYISSQFIGNNGSFSPTPYSSFNIVATEDNTSVTITPSKNIVGHAALIPFTIILNKGQTYAAIATSQIAAQHLHGSYITSTKPIAITISDDLLNAPTFGTCSDLVGDQTIPTSIIGNEYIAIRGNLFSPFDKVYVTAIFNNTAIYKDGVLVNTLNAGQSTELSLTNNATYINSTLPFYTYHLSGIGCELGSAILPPITCTGSNSVSIARSTTLNLYITVLVKSGGENSFTINGNNTVLTGSQFTPVPGTSNQWLTAKFLLPLANYPLGLSITIANSLSLFHLGVLQGDAAGGTSFGYFSNFKNITAHAFALNNNICEGLAINLFADTVNSASYQWAGPNGFSSNQQNPVINPTTLLNSGKYFLTLTVPNCGIYLDSVNITVKPKSFSTIIQSICQGQSFLGYTNAGTYLDTLIAVNGCDSIRTLNLTVKPRSFLTINQSICQGQNFLGYTNTGTYIDTFVAANGCDSIHTINLTVKPRSFLTINQSICQGQSFLGYTNAGTYLDTLVAANGCDSIRTLNLTVKPRSFSTINQSICQGQSFLGYTNAGTYLDTLVAANGCDSIRTLNLTVKPRSFSTINQSVCQGQSFLGYTNAGTYLDTLVAANGCDSIRTINLTIKPKSFLTINQSVCQGQSFLGYTNAGTYLDTLVAANGCDSIRTLNLTVKPKSFSTINQSICQGQSFLGYTNAGIYIDTLIAINGCDSIRTLNLALSTTPNPNLGIDKEICTGDTLLISPGIFYSYLWQDGSTGTKFSVSQSGLYFVTVTNLCGSKRDDILITERLCDFYFPNAFTPNKDGKNDDFKILGASVPKDYSLLIYNRFGQKVFETNDYTKGWDGTYKGKNAVVGNYVWYSTFKKSMTFKKMKGTVILIR